MKLIQKMNDLGLNATQRTHSFASGTQGAYIFGMGITNRGTREEGFEIWPGQDNEVALMDTDAKLRQLVLHIHEPERAFREDVVFDTAADLKSRLMAPGVKLISIESPHLAKIERKTSSDRRAILLGLDEKYRFIAQLPKLAPTVAQAHASLRPPDITPRAVRQGEFFLDPVSDGTQQEVERLLRTAAVTIERERPLPGRAGGTPHVVDELVTLRTSKRTEVYARGTVRQAPRHAPLKLGKRFHTIHPNLEVGQPRGFGWVD